MPPRRLKLQGLLILILLALISAASLLLMPLETALPAGVDLPRAVFIIQPTVLLLLSAVVGWWAAPKVDLKAPILSGLVRRRPWKASLRCAILPSVLVGIAGALVLGAYGAATASFFTDAEAALGPPLVTRILYGGIGEEIMLRWGLMSLLALMASKLPSPARRLCGARISWPPCCSVWAIFPRSTQSSPHRLPGSSQLLLRVTQCWVWPSAGFTCAEVWKRRC